MMDYVIFTAALRRAESLSCAGPAGLTRPTELADNALFPVRVISLSEWRSRIVGCAR